MLSLVVVLLGLVPGCDPSPEAFAAVGVQGNPGSPILLYVLCEGELVTSIEITTGGPSEDPTIVWRVTSPGSRATRYPLDVTSTPPGYAGEVVSPIQLQASRDYVVFVETNRQSVASVGFSPDQLEDGEVWTGQDTFVAPSLFQEEGRASCQ